MRKALAGMLAGVLVGCAGQVTKTPHLETAATRPAPMSVAALRAHQFETMLRFERTLDEGESFTAFLVSYRHAGLKLYAMVAVPRSRSPETGYPLVIANHGYVPDPRKYGITKEGRDSRPGDYYRSVPELFASRGFLVVIPDYRGHNSSEGFEYINPQDENSAAFYAEDVVALMAALGDLEQADPDKVFMWSHSMGGPVSLRALLATDIVKASSFWSTMSVKDLVGLLGELDGPVMIQHSRWDQATQHLNSEGLAKALERISHPHEFKSYASHDHFFTGEMRELAADRDARFFNTSTHVEPEGKD